MRLKISFDTKNLFLNKKKLTAICLGIIAFIGITWYPYADKAENIKTFAYGDLVTSEDINKNFAAISGGHDNLVEKISNMIAFFAGTCPAGWSEYTAARGRVILGTFTNGSPGNTNTDDDGTATATAFTTGSTRRFVANVANHSHNLSANSSSTGHAHPGIAVEIGAGVSTYDYASGTGDHLHSGGSGNTSSTTNNSTAGSGAAANSVDVTMPYIQLTACQLNSP